MRNILFTFFCLFVGAYSAFPQTSEKDVVGVAKFTSEVNSPFVDAVAEKVVQVVTNTKRFIVVDRTSYDKVKEELEFQKTEAFLDSKNTVKQDVALAAHYMIIGHLVKMNIYSMKNPDGSVNGYKASASFTLKVNDVETGMVTEATAFQTSTSPLAMSKEQAVNQALQSVEEPLNNYFSKTFPVYAKILRIQESKKNSASKILIDGGVGQGIKVGDMLVVETIEMLGGKPYPTEIGSIKVEKSSGNDFSECAVLKGGKEIYSKFNASQEIKCKLIVK
ncbi:MAG: penicillin-binding protein activator LpoB [Salinivirgaceae bacterium]|nr:penicillin-binding protein activator LpoB [Salinivirgaceae bacterium]